MIKDKNNKKNQNITFYIFIEKNVNVEKKVVVMTQEDKSPEYSTSVRVLCDCGELILFELPVN